MSEPENKGLPKRRCEQCGAELPSHLPPDLCPQCMLKTALVAPEGPAKGNAADQDVPEPRRGLPGPGEQLGHYRLVRLLGGGGMGAVFEAEDLDSGRRVALKILSQALDSPESRQRFFREGRLAASINHPNSVYIFGTEEIGGTPVIAMELVAGGTLEDRIRATGPMEPAAAVDAVLGIVAGLEAAQRTGILHRDVKPSNCFVDRENSVKIGDFGLSISTAVRSEPALTANGAFLGTPAFCSPEQLRGEELNARSDMYSIGATLFYLLTGRTPFAAKNVVALIATVLEHPAPSPRQFSPSVPQGLAKAVMRCLEKQSDRRFASYEELRQALAPFGSTTPAPAALGVRFLAGLLDLVFLSLCAMLVVLPGVGHPLDFLDLMARGSWRAFGLLAGGLTASLLYYALLEKFRGATVGKAICGLRVMSSDRNLPGWGQAFGRAGIYVVLPVLPAWAFFGGDPRNFYLSSSNGLQYLISSSFYVVLALLFCTARRRNGFAAVQDLLTRTRVASRVALQARPVLPALEGPPAMVEAKPMVGPYHVLETLEENAETKWLLGYDLRLLRKVWLRVAPPGAPPVPAALRNIARVGRLRWLAGRRSPTDNWDAFEALSGQPWLSLLARESADPSKAVVNKTGYAKKAPASTRQPWERVRYWLWDMATELCAAEKDGTQPQTLALDRVWITAEGRAKLLDWPAPGLGAAANISARLTRPITAQEFFGELASASLAGHVQARETPPGEVAVALPLHVRAFLKELRGLATPDALLTALRSLLHRATVVTRWRRAAMVAGCLAFPLFCAGSMMLGLRLMERWVQQHPGLLELQQVLGVRSTMRFWAKPDRGPTDRQFAIYIANHYASVVTNQASWSSTLAISLIKGESRGFAEKSVAEHVSASASEVAEADAALKSYEPDVAWFRLAWSPSFAILASTMILAIYVGIPALLAALLFRGGLVMVVAGVALVRRDGLRASRGRLLWRALVTWSPIVVLLACSATCMEMKIVWGQWLGAGLALALAALSVALPERGLQDRLAGTWPVPK